MLDKQLDELFDRGSKIKMRQMLRGVSLNLKDNAALMPSFKKMARKFEKEKPGFILRWQRDNHRS